MSTPASKSTSVRLALRKLSPCHRKDLVDATGLTARQVAKALQHLRRHGQAVCSGRGEGRGEWRTPEVAHGE